MESPLSFIEKGNMAKDNSWQHKPKNLLTYKSPYARYLEGYALQGQFIKLVSEPDKDGNVTETYKFPQQAAASDRFWTVTASNVLGEDEKKKAGPFTLEGDAILVGDRFIFASPYGDLDIAVGGLISEEFKGATESFVLEFEYRIYGSTTLYFADGLAITYCKNHVIGGAGLNLGRPSGDLIIDTGIDTYNNATGDNTDYPIVYLGGIAGFTSTEDSGARSSSWRMAKIICTIAEIAGNQTFAIISSFNGVTLSRGPFVFDDSGSKWLHITAARATYDDYHEVRKGSVKLNGDVVA